MELKEVINKRHSVRVFQDKDVPDEILEELIALARKSPSAGGIRGYQVIITREKIISYNAPVCIVICIDSEKYTIRYGDRGESLYAIQDSAIFAAYLQLLLVDAGLASVWIGSFREGKIQRSLNTKLRPIAIIAIGYQKDILG